MAIMLVTTDLVTKIANVYNIFKECINNGTDIYLAYSGGKDSTVLAILLYEWLKRNKIEGKVNIPKTITIIHNDTLSEINPMEEWAKRFMTEYARRLEELGITVKIDIAKPNIIDTFYWRVIVRGYPAPTFNFRWCVELLKIRPTKASMPNSNNSNGNGSSNSNGSNDNSNKRIVLVGSRDDESTKRKAFMNKRYYGCPTGKCTAYYFSMLDNKVAPLRDWSTADIWEYLRRVTAFNVDELFWLYGCDEARYGCWHCTLVKKQWGIYSQGKREYMYLEALRILYRLISDIHELRVKKKQGYSRYGALNATARSILLQLFRVIEEKGKDVGLRLYGLDEKIEVEGERVGEGEGEGYTLREIFYELNSKEEVEGIVKKIDPYAIASNRYIDLTNLRQSKSENVTATISKLKLIVEKERNEWITDQIKPFILNLLSLY